jgi:hypothetical protein
MKLGRTGRPGRSPNDRRTLWYGRYASTPGYTAPPPYEDWTGDRSAFTFLGNDRAGCCTRACYGHVVQQRCALLETACKLTEDHVLAAYQAGTGWDGVPGSASDRGDNILSALVQMKNSGLGPYRIRSFGRVNTHDPIEMRAALHTFGSLIVGANLPRRIQRDGYDWDVSPLGARTADEAPGTLGGHAFILTGHQRGQWFGLPWVDRVSISYAWEDLYLDEAWFVVDDLWITANRKAPNGFDLARLQADAAAISA